MIHGIQHCTHSSFSLCLVHNCLWTLNSWLLETHSWIVCLTSCNSNRLFFAQSLRKYTNDRSVVVFGTELEGATSFENQWDRWIIGLSLAMLNLLFVPQRHLTETKSYSLTANKNMKLIISAMTFSRSDSSVKIWRLYDVSGTNSVLIFRVYWWFGRKFRWILLPPKLQNLLRN